MIPLWIAQFSEFKNCVNSKFLGLRPWWAINRLLIPTAGKGLFPFTMVSRSTPIRWVLSALPHTYSDRIVKQNTCVHWGLGSRMCRHTPAYSYTSLWCGASSQKQFSFLFSTHNCFFGLLIFHRFALTTAATQIYSCKFGIWHLQERIVPMLPLISGEQKFLIK